MGEPDVAIVPQQTRVSNLPDKIQLNALHNYSESER